MGGRAAMHAAKDGCRSRPPAALPRHVRTHTVYRHILAHVSQEHLESTLAAAGSCECLRKQE